LLDRRGEDFAEIVQVAARRILGGELNVLGKRAYEPHRVPRHLEHFGARLFQFMFEMYVRGGDEGVEPRASGSADRLPGAQNVLLGRAAERGDRGLTTFGRDGLDRGEVAVRGDGKARL